MSKGDAEGGFDSPPFHSRTRAHGLAATARPDLATPERGRRSGKMRLDIRQITLSDVLRAVVEAAQPAARAKDLDVHLEIDPQIDTIAADSTFL